MKKLLSILLLTIVVMSSCKDDWDNFYGDDNDERGAGSTITILEYLENHPKKYSKFLQLVKDINFESELSSERVLTLWVPTDSYIEDTVMNFNQFDKRRFVLNHINALALYKSKLASKSKIETLAGKYVSISGSGNSFTINKVKVTSLDGACSNGVVHELGGVLTPYKNLMEYIKECGDDYSIFRDSLFAYNDTIFRADLSYAIGVNEVGQTIYDSVYQIKNWLTRDIDFEDEETTATLIIPSNQTIENMLTDMNQWFTALGETMDRNDSLSCLNFVLKASFLYGEFTSFPKTFGTGGGKVLKLDYQLISTNYTKCSNGVVYQFEKIYIPKGTFMSKVDYVPMNIFELDPSEWPSLYQHSNSSFVLNNLETNSSDNVTNNIFFDSNSPNRKFINIKCENGEWIEFTILTKSLKGLVEKPKLMPGKYKVQGWAYGWRSANVKISVNGTPLKFTANGSTTIEFGSNSYFDYGAIHNLCDTVDIPVSRGVDVIKFEAVGSGSKANALRFRELLFTPVGDNY